ncbi:MerR family transcriptional regulator [Neptuniibacter pectenicola]|uniref:MerR family transcriptional regulator n=1 Tax=Neptuniibacter pectenicola TaxID=1806669 RepID=A0ABU9TSC1_9GAMM
MTDKAHNIDNYFPIRDLSARTEVNTVTLRAWERRYGLLKPQRTPKGHRLYCEQDVTTVERILELVARGVPIGKVKPLLLGDTLQPVKHNEIGTWHTLTSELLEAAESFSVTKLEQQIQLIFSNYPIQVCRERLIIPAFITLSQRDDEGAAFGFMENEIVRYALMRLSAKVNKKQRTRSATLIAGNKAPAWALALMALELTDLNFSVYLFNRTFSVLAGIELAKQFKSSNSIYYQDGILKEDEKTLLAAALVDNERLFLCGTAPFLSQFKQNNRVFENLKDCIDDLHK